MALQVNRFRARCGPIWPYVVLIAIPAAAFVLPDLVGGHLLMTGDNAQQNYPLHVLVGSMLRHGQLPFWDPYIFSGTPLLAGFNAGAFYPLVGLFVVLPDRVAWIMLEVALFSGIAIGMYVFLRALAISTVAAVLAGGTFAFSGVVLSQVNHVDMTEGFVALPLMMLAVLHIVRDGRWRWAVLLGIGLALVILGGAPEAMLDLALFIVGYAVFSAGFSRNSWWRVLSRGGAGAALGLALAAIQWLPGLSAIAHSQRAGLGGGFASAGSFPPADGLLAVVPYLYGGYHYLGESSFFAGYNLPEVGTYMGILPIIAVLALLNPAWPSRISGRDRLSLYLAGLFALLLALGGNTPLEHLFNSIPLYGNQRLQSRNMIGVSAVCCVLFAGWLDRTKEPTGRTRVLDRCAGMAPFALVLGLATWALVAPDSLITSLTRTSSSSTGMVHTVREASLIALGFAAVAGFIALSRGCLGPRKWMGAVSLFVVADLGIIAGTSQLLVTPSAAVLSGTTTIDQYLSSHLPPGGRYDFYDPQGYAGGYGTLSPLPDANILAQLPSVAGYASIVNGNYNAVTETHSVGDLNVSALGSGELDGLDLQDLVTVPQYFVLPVSGLPPDIAHVQPLTVRRGADPVLTLGFRTSLDDSLYPATPPARGTLATGGTDRWFLGEPVHPDSASLVFTAGATDAQVRFGLIGDTNSVKWGPTVAVRRGTLSVTGALPSAAAVGVAVQVVSGRVPGHQAFMSVDGRQYELDGALSAAVTPGPWRFQGISQRLSVLARTTPSHPLRVVGSEGAAAPPVQIVSSSVKSETVRVRAPAQLNVERDVAWDSGWRAMVSVNGGRPHSIPVTQTDLVQEVRIPAGDDVITFNYRPPHLLAASLLSAGAVVGLLGLLCGWTVVRRRRFSRRDGPA